MTKLVHELLFVGKDNTFAVKFKINNSRRDFSTVTKVEFTLGSTLVDSVANPEYFDLTQGTGTIQFNLGAAGYTANDSGVALITVYDPQNPDGIVFSSSRGPTKVDVEVI